MQTYINQLLEDMENAQRSGDTFVEKNFSHASSIEDEFAEIERWLNNDPVHPFSYYCGLEKEQFPPAEMLSKKQMQQISKAFLSLLHSWNLGADFPKKFPLTNKYTLLTGLLNKKTDIVRHGFMTFDFCSGDSTSCEFGEYCTCRKWHNETSEVKEIDSKSPDNDRPF